MTTATCPFCNCPVPGPIILRHVLRGEEPGIVGQGACDGGVPWRYVCDSKGDKVIGGDGGRVYAVAEDMLDLREVDLDDIVEHMALENREIVHQLADIGERIARLGYDNDSLLAYLESLPDSAAGNDQ
jgi:hypothetical protein